MQSSGPQVNYFPYCKRYRPSGMLIHGKENSFAHRSKQRSGCREAQSREPLNKIKNIYIYL
jgi:hypothetical protein